MKYSNIVNYVYNGNIIIYGVRVMSKANYKRLMWIARIVLIAAILFFSIFSLDVFSSNANVLNKIIGFLIQMIPAFILILLLYASFKNGLLSGAGCIVASIAFTLFFRTYLNILTFIAITLTLAFCGVVFIMLYNSNVKKYNR